MRKTIVRELKKKRKKSCQKLKNKKTLDSDAFRLLLP